VHRWIHLFGSVEDALVKALAAPLIKLAPTMKATHLASNAQALARMKAGQAKIPMGFFYVFFLWFLWFLIVKNHE
jgi:hypothetical protein